MEQEPKYPIRLLVDIAIRALSPAVNDQTTGVQAIDQIEDLLRLLGQSDLDAGQIRDAGGELRVIVPMPTWHDYLSLSFDEICQFGLTSVQILRRLRSALSGFGSGNSPPTSAGKRQHGIFATSILTSSGQPLTTRIGQPHARRIGRGLECPASRRPRFCHSDGSAFGRPGWSGTAVAVVEPVPFVAIMDCARHVPRHRRGGNNPDQRLSAQSGPRSLADTACASPFRPAATWRDTHPDHRLASNRASGA